jgi:hypothetical protein
MATLPDVTKRYSDAEGKLFRNARLLPDGTQCDLVIVQHFTGNEDKVVIYTTDGERTIARLRLQMNFSVGSPASRATTTTNEFLQPLDDEDQKRLLRTYDDLLAAAQVRECVCINPGLNGPGTQVVDPDGLTQVWRVTFGDGFVGEIRVSPTEGVTHKGKVKDMVSELATCIRKSGGQQFPYSTNNLSASLNAAR